MGGRGSASALAKWERRGAFRLLDKAENSDILRQKIKDALASMEYERGSDSSDEIANKFADEDNKVLVPLLREAEQLKLITYEKPIEDHVDGTERRDLFAHAALVAAGHTVTVRREHDGKGKKAVDLLDNFHYAEVKSLTGGNINRAFNKAYKQFVGDPDANVNEQRVVLNLRYATGSHSKIVKKAVERLNDKDDLVEVIVVGKDGKVDIFM